MDGSVWLLFLFGNVQGVYADEDMARKFLGEGSGWRIQEWGVQ
jgi:hypothetical protein